MTQDSCKVARNKPCWKTPTGLTYASCALSAQQSTGLLRQNFRHPRLRRRFAVGEKIIGLALPSIFSTAAPKAPRFICRRQRFGAFPKAGACFACKVSKFESPVRKRKAKRAKALSAFLVRVGRLELPASCSQSRRATNCATPGDLRCAVRLWAAHLS